MIPTRLPPLRTVEHTAPPDLGWVRVDQRLRDTAHDLGVELTVSPLFSLLGLALIVGVFGSRLFAPVPAGVAVIAVLIAPWPLERIARGRAHRRRLGSLPRQCTKMARAIRSGAPLASALVELAADGECAAPLRSVGLQVSRGRPVNEALAELTEATDESVRLLAAALLMGEEHGGDLAFCLDSAAGSLRHEQAAASRRRVAVAQSQMSARVLASLPILFALLVSMMRPGPVFEGSIGVIAAAAGVGLNAIGLFWMHSLIGRMK